MKKYNMLLIVIVLMTINVFGQKKYNIGTKKPDENKNNSIESKIKAVYYFIDLKSDSLFFTKDSLIFSKHMTKWDFPKLNLFEDFRFQFEYNFYLDTIKIIDTKDNSMMTKIIEVSQKVEGKWKSTDLQKNVSLILREDLIVDYNLVEFNNLLYFIRK